MLRTVTVSIWAAVVTLGVFYLGTRLSESEDAPGEKAAIALEDHETEVLTIALFHQGQMVGHLATRVKYRLPKGVQDNFPFPVQHEISDGLYQTLADMALEQIRQMKQPQLQAIGEKLTSTLNQRPRPLPISDVSLERTRLVLKQKG